MDIDAKVYGIEVSRWTVWRINTSLGPTWVQSMNPTLPRINRVLEVIRDVQRLRSFASGHQRRRRQPAPRLLVRNGTTAARE